MRPHPDHTCYAHRFTAWVQINDRYEFFEELDLDKGKPGAAQPPAYLSEKADRSVSNVYKLLAVLVHTGGVHGGHYYAYIRPDGSQWLKFDDDRVEKVEAEKAVQDNWGGEDEKAPPMGYNAIKMSKLANAYMLVYVRASDWATVMCDVGMQDVSAHVQARLKAEAEEKEKKKRERSEAHLYTQLRIATDEDLRAQIGHSSYFELVDFERVGLTLKLPKKAPFSEVQRLVAERLGVPPDSQRYWKWQRRQNDTYRPAGLLALEGPDQAIATLHDARSGGRSAPYKSGEMVKLNLYLETPQGVPPTFLLITKDHVLLFFKHFIPGDATHPPRLEFAGRAVFPKTARIGDMHPLMAKMGGLLLDTPLDVFEEVKFEPAVMVESLVRTMSISSAQLEHGDILVFQRRLAPAEAQQAEYPSAAEFLKHVHNRMTVAFRPLASGGNGDEEAPTLSIDLLKDMQYQDVSSALAHRLSLDHPLKVRLTAQSPFSLMPRPTPLKFSTEWTLEEMLRGSTAAGGALGAAGAEGVLFYEVIDLPLPEYERLVTHRITFHNAKHEEAGSVTVQLPKDRTVGELLEEVRRQVPAEAHGGAPLRLMEVYHWRIWQLFDPAQRLDKCLDLVNLWHLRAEVVPEDQRSLAEPGALHVLCLQVEDKEGGSGARKEAFPFSDPFIMSIGEAETVGQFKARVQKEMAISDEDFASWKVVIIT